MVGYFNLSVAGCYVKLVIKLLIKLVMFSRVSFGIVVILLIAATSMSRKQLYGKGWLNGECYIVKGGTYSGSAILILVTIGSLNGSSFSILKTRQEQEDQKILKQSGLH